MKRIAESKYFIWVPRILVILFALFLMLFSFDVFEDGQVDWAHITGFLMHNIPSVILLVLLFSTWKSPWWAGMLFVFAGVMLTLFFGTWKELVPFLLISFPVFLVGFLFFWVNSERISRE